LDRLKGLIDLIPKKYKIAGAFFLSLTLILIFIIYHAEIYHIFLDIVQIIVFFFFLIIIILGMADS